jgi:hypothetical protein
MTISTRREFLVGAGASLVMVAPPALFAFDARNNPYHFALLPGATMSISVTFNSGWVNAVGFSDERVGGFFSKWPGCGNRDTKNPKSFQYTNGESAAVPFSIGYGYKPTTRDDPNVNWGAPHPGVVKSYSRQAITLGYTDGTSPSNDNCLITITVTSGELPSGA